MCTELEGFNFLNNFSNFFKELLEDLTKEQQFLFVYYQNRHYLNKLDKKLMKEVRRVYFER